MKRFLTKNNWWFYFILTCLISWPVWILGNNILPENLRAITLITGAFGPFVAAMIILRITAGYEEPGWRGYITPVLMNLFNPFISCVIVGIGWAVLLYCFLAFLVSCSKEPDNRLPLASQYNIDGDGLGRAVHFHCS
jgi:membrane protease YdiL (CAAX protease family)